MYVLATDLPLLSHFGEYMLPGQGNIGRASNNNRQDLLKRKRKRKVMKHI
jgi:hypothetical protein